MEPRYIVLGAGGVGCSVGGLLQKRAGKQVVFVARGTQLQALRGRGLELRTADASWTMAVEACDEGSLRQTDADVVLLCTKSQDSAAALDALEVNDRAVVCMQNGVANERLVAERGGRPYAAMVFLPASFLQPGRVTIHSSPCPGIVDVGVYPRGIDAVCERLVSDLCAAGVDSRALEDVMPWKYAKLISNLNNVLQALGGADALKLPAERPLRKEVQAEGVAVLEAAGVSCRPLRELYQRGSAVNDLPVDGEARRGGSSWQSLARGGALETPYLNGEIVRLGGEHGVATPLNARLVALAQRASDEGWPPAKLSFAELFDAVGRG